MTTSVTVCAEAELIRKASSSTSEESSLIVRIDAAEPLRLELVMRVISSERAAYRATADAVCFGTEPTMRCCILRRAETRICV